MSVTFKMVFSIVLGVFIVAGSFSLIQVNDEKHRIQADLERRSVTLAESLKETIIPAIESQSMPKLNRLVEKFGNRERLKGIAIFDVSGNIISSTTFLKSVLTSPYTEAINTIVDKSSNSKFIKVKNQNFYLYTVPLFSESNGEEKLIGALTLFQDASFIDVRIKEVWKHNLVRSFFLTLAISIITIIIINWTIKSPISQIAEWLKAVRTNSVRLTTPPVRGDILDPLIKEVENITKTISNINAKLSEEENMSKQEDKTWNAEKLKDFINKKFGEKRLFLASNREPYLHIKDGEKIRCVMPAGGLVTALDPVMKACSGVWIAHGSGEADWEVVDENNKVQIPPEKPLYFIKRIFLSKQEEKGYYYGFSNEGLWPLCHLTYIRPAFRIEDWEHYQRVNEKFANALIEEIKNEESPFVLVQDYHLALVPLLIKTRRPDAKVAIFWHIPWPNPEVFGICPWAREILLGMLGADLIGFHIQFYCNNFLETVDRMLESKINWEQFNIERKGHTTFVKPIPISIDFEDFSNNQSDINNIREEIKRELNINAQFIGIGVDRIDYTKGILERFLAIERFLEKYPQFVGSFCFIQMGSPSRVHIKQYRDLIKEIEEACERINWKFQIRNYKPIIFLKDYHEHSDIIPFYKLANFCIVNSLHDGMNLVAKEFIATRNDEDGVLILSQFAGASRELKDAIIINPYDIENTADAIYEALVMNEQERKERMNKMRNIVKERNIYLWAKDLIQHLVGI